VSGVYVLYNNMLQSLFQSQILTLGVVYGAIFLMFIVLFASLRLALIAMVPNLFPPAFVLGSMGFTGLPLDIMTITIAAITIGIAVDHTIHYVIRFKREFAIIGNYSETASYCHAHIGRAMYYTSLTIIFGFSILVLSQFKPTMYFGIFTGLAMVVALVAALTLLPVLLVKMKPLGVEEGASA
jgi:predicted RND superfamily exporter protein